MEVLPGTAASTVERVRLSHMGLGVGAEASLSRRGLVQLAGAVGVLTGTELLKPPPSLAKSAPLLDLREGSDERGIHWGTHHSCVLAEDWARQIKNDLRTESIPGCDAGHAEQNPAVPANIDHDPSCTGAEGGFVPVNDQGDAYKFVYPFGWQEVSVTGQVRRVCHRTHGIRVATD